MITIKSRTANQAWIDTFKSLIKHGAETDNQKYFRDEMALIEITDPKIEPADPNFPMLQSDLDVINHYIVSGENEAAVVHEWTKIYHHRIFDEPNSQIEYLINKLKSKEPRGETQISIWDKATDQTSAVHPCTQIIWARIKHGKLELHVHANSSDAYKKLLMNVLEFIALQHYIAERIGIPAGNYYHFLDSCHLHVNDKDAIDAFYKEI